MNELSSRQYLLATCLQHSPSHQPNTSAEKDKRASTLGRFGEVATADAYIGWLEQPAPQLGEGEKPSLLPIVYPNLCD